MSDKNLSPKITDLSWGRIEVEGGIVYKDVKMYPGGSREWDWRETGTEHVPGIQPDDVAELLDHGAEIVVLSKGVYERLQIRPDTLRFLSDRAVTVHIRKTDEAVALYNDLCESQRVGALIHSTC